MGRVDFAAWRNNDVWITCRLYLLYDNIIHNGQLRFFFFSMHWWNFYDVSYELNRGNTEFSVER